jgi:signal transduction histidine kinase
VAHEITWTSDPDPGRRLLDLREQLLACFQEGLGHELRNQFLVIQHYLAVAVEAERGDRRGGETRDELDRLTQLVTKADELTRALAELGRLCREPGPAVAVDLGEAVREAAAHVKVLSPQRVIEYDVQVPMPAVQAPWRPLHKALFHLLRNAVEAVGEGQPAQVRAAAEATPGGVALHVSDRGRGLTADQLKRLLSPFPTGAATAGQGLGLFLVRQAAALWGGGVRVRSEPGAGTTVSLLFTNSVAG